MNRKPDRKPLLTELARRGRPLIDVVVSLQAQIDQQTVIAALRALGPDIDAIAWQCGTILVTSIPAALEREFGWRIERELMPNSTSYHWWRDLNRPARLPSTLAGCIASMYLSQPGGDDDGQPDVVDP